MNILPQKLRQLQRRLQLLESQRWESQRWKNRKPLSKNDEKVSEVK
jgi:hypothetical protein